MPTIQKRMKTAAITITTLPSVQPPGLAGWYPG
jgi:hypothetical protein